MITFSWFINVNKAMNLDGAITSDIESTFLKSVCSTFIHPHACKVFHAGVPNYFRESSNYMNDNI